MKISIEKIGKINKAEIKIDGLTVIAGKNSTGKSTVSKSLFSIFNSFHKITQTHREYKERAVRERVLDLDNFLEIFFMDDFAVDLGSVVMKLVSTTSRNDIERVLQSFQLDKKLSESNYAKIISEIDKINQSSLEDVLYEETNNYFQSEFSYNINNVNSKTEIGSIFLKIKENQIETFFENDKLVKVGSYFSLDFKPVYIDDPFIIDTVNQTEFKMFRSNSDIDRTHREVLLNQYNKKISDNPIEKIILKEDLQVVYDKISNILDENSSGITYSYNTGLKDKRILSIDNLSSGMKTFYLLKKLLDNATIQQYSPVILDEPEVHLHPEWQLVLAEIIVLLQKYMDLNFLINSHSPYFVRAIEVYSLKYAVDSKTRYYLARMQNDLSEFEDVTGNVSKIYKILAEPLQNIENERFI
ncbi:AAA family ATPase [Streptococcus ruminantium]|uniref:AAA family ATPase n=1 Tax=Streptococcus ruminantium TaxID=1917441 RepID=UPI001F401180|nr:AAA family ATPase [Streptococcus ruminantium]BDD40790.1 ABC transporter ATP-binding protein [Streptococcus ruminantium]